MQPESLSHLKLSFGLAGANNGEEPGAPEDGNHSVGQQETNGAQTVPLMASQNPSTQSVDQDIPTGTQLKVELHQEPGRFVYRLIQPRTGAVVHQIALDAPVPDIMPTQSFPGLIFDIQA